MKPTEPSPLCQTRTRRTADLSRITGQEVMTALIDQLLADPDLSAQIIRTLRSRR